MPDVLGHVQRLWLAARAVPSACYQGSPHRVIGGSSSRWHLCVADAPVGQREIVVLTMCVCVCRGNADVKLSAGGRVTTAAVPLVCMMIMMMMHDVHVLVMTHGGV